DAHHYAAFGGVADLGEAGILEDLPGADVQLAPRDHLARLGDHRVRLQGARPSRARVPDGGLGERVGQAAAPVTLAHHQAGDRPDAVVVAVLVAPRPRHRRARRDQLRVGRPRLDRGPAGRLVVD